MKVIVDTCIWSLALRRRDKSRLSAEDQQMVMQLTEAIQDRRAAIIGPIRQEILSGIRNRAQFAKTEGTLDLFRDEEITVADYVEAARFYNLCQDRGVQCGPVDILLCAVAARKQYGILTSDQALNRCVEVLRSEGLIR
ncbi:MAG: PIN domain-containing protein [Terracidiphilus sp.]